MNPLHRCVLWSETPKGTSRLKPKADDRYCVCSLFFTRRRNMRVSYVLAVSAARERVHVERCAGSVSSQGEGACGEVSLALLREWFCVCLFVDVGVCVLV